MSELITVEQVARQLHVTPQTVWKYIKSGRLQACRVGNKYQFKQEWVDAFLDRQKVQVGRIGK
jgi:excisionase family DNA binding protein